MIFKHIKHGLEFQQVRMSLLVSKFYSNFLFKKFLATTTTKSWFDRIQQTSLILTGKIQISFEFQILFTYVSVAPKTTTTTKSGDWFNPFPTQTTTTTTKAGNLFMPVECKLY
jgi:hypothetical protein